MSVEFDPQPVIVIHQRLGKERMAYGLWPIAHEQIWHVIVFASSPGHKLSVVLSGPQRSVLSTPNAISYQPYAHSLKAPRLAATHDQYCEAFMYPNSRSRRARMPTSLLFRTTGTRVI